MSHDINEPCCYFELIEVLKEKGSNAQVMFPCTGRGSVAPYNNAVEKVCLRVNRLVRVGWDESLSCVLG